MSVVPRTALPLLNATAVTHEKTNRDQLQGEASLIKEKDVQTLVYYYKRCQWVLLALKGEYDTADLMKCFIR